MTQLRKQICNKKEKKVCCKIEPPTNEQTNKIEQPTNENTNSISPNDSSSPSYLPDPLKGECGISGTAEFVLGLTDKFLKEMNS